MDILTKIKDFITGKKEIERVTDCLLRLNPDKFYVEEVCELCKVSYRVSLSLCEDAVKAGDFERVEKGDEFYYKLIL